MQMRTRISYVIVLIAILFTAAAVEAQQQRPAGEVDFAVTYTANRANLTTNPSFWMQGGSAELAGQLWHGLAGVANITGLHTGGGTSGVPLSIVTDTFGPRYRWSIPTKMSRREVSVFGQGLIGEAHGFYSIFPGRPGASTNALSFALQLGGGVDVALSHHFSLRAVEADWLRTQLPNSTTNVQNDFHIASGIVFHTASRK